MRALRRFGEHGVEAGWLGAVLLTPLFLDKTGAQVFEPAKVGLLRALSLFVAVAWSIKALCSPRGGAKETAGPASTVAFRRDAASALIAAVGLVVLSTLAATALSLSPYESFWGHRENAQGALTLLAQVLIFAAVACNLRREDQLRRLLTAWILPSVPITLYALFQRFGLEPLHVTVRETELQRVTSLLGQPVFLSAYLGMVMPFCALRVAEALRARDQQPARRWLSFALYALLLALQALAALFTESRGPLLAIVGAFAVAALAWAAEARARRSVIGMWGLAACAGLLFALWSSGRTPAATAVQSQSAKRAAETFAVSGGGGQFRVTSWQVAARVFANTEPLELADGSRDARAGLRKLFGYGPELQYAISPAFYDAQLTRLFGYFLTSRYHNDLWDVLIACGSFGLLAWLALQASVLWLLTRELIALRERWFWLAIAGGALVGALVAGTLRGASFAFLGLTLGGSAGLALFLSVVSFVRVGAEQENAPTPRPHGELVLGVRCAALAAIVAHLIETSFSFTIAATGLLFWICCALALATPRIAPAHGTDVEPGSALGEGALLGLVLSALGFAFLGATQLALRPGEIIWDGLTALSQPADARAPVVLIISASTLLLGALLFALEAVRTRQELPLAGRLSRVAGWAVGIALVYWLRLAFLLTELVKPVAERALLVSMRLDARSAATRSLLLASFALMVLFALSRTTRAESAPRIAVWRIPASVVCALLGAVLLQPCMLAPAGAESAVALGDGLRAQGELTLAEQAYQRSRELRPKVDAYDALLGKLHNVQARADAAHAATWFERGEQLFSEAIAKNPAAGEHLVNLALLRGQRALRAPAVARAGITPEVAALYRRALRLNPQDPALLRNWSAAQANLLGDLAGALASARAALSLEPDNAAAHSLVAEIQLKRAAAQSAEARRSTYLEAAAEYARARALAPAEASYRVNEGKAYLGAGEREQAIASFRAALRVLPAESRSGQAVAVLLRRAEAGEPQ